MANQVGKHYKIEDKPGKLEKAFSRQEESCSFRTSIGGQALMEGILMRGPKTRRSPSPRRKSPPSPTRRSPQRLRKTTTKEITGFPVTVRKEKTSCPN